MSILKKIRNTAGNLFRSIRDTINNYGRSGNTANALDYNNPVNKDLQSYYASNPGTSPVSQYGNTGSGSGSSSGYVPKYKTTLPAARIVPQVYPGSTGPGTNQNLRISGNTNYGSGSSGGGQVAAPQRLARSDAQEYARSAGLASGVNLEGKTYEEADQIISLIKEAQKGQNTALTSAVFSPQTPSTVEKRIKDMSLSLDAIKNDPWKNVGSKQEDVDNLLKSTANDLASMFDSTEAMVNAYDTNDTVRNSLDAFAQFGGSDQMLIDAIDAKKRTTESKDMTTPEYLASLTAADTSNNEQMQVDKIMNGDKIITDEIARTAAIPEALKDRYFGDGGIWEQRINLEKERINLLKEKIADEKAAAREKAKYYMQKNEADLAVAKSTIEQNRINAKNYLSGMLAKLGALNTTSAAAEGIAFLDQKYQKQATDAETKVNLANREIEMSLDKMINDIENNGSENIQRIKEDLSKDQETILKEIAKEESASEKRIFELTLKADERARKNIAKYTNDLTTLANDYTEQFSSLVSGGLDVGQAAGMVNVPLPKSDKQVSESARIKDPSAISYFKALPTEFRNEWIQFASSQPKGTYFTLADLQANYEPYVLEKRGEVKGNKTSSSTSDINDL